MQYVSPKIQEFANSEISTERESNRAIPRSATAMCWIITTKDWFILKVSWFKDAIKINVFPMRDDRKMKR